MKWLLCLLLFSVVYANDVETEVKELQQKSAEVLQQIQNMPVSLNGAKFDAVRVKAMKLASDERFIKAATDLWSHPNRNTVLIVQGVFYLFMILFKSWKQSQASNWFSKAITGLFLSVFSWVMLIYCIPAFILGAPYRIVISTLWNTLFG